MNTREWLCLGGLAAWALVIRIFFLRTTGIALPDEAYYIQMGQNLIRGGPYGAFGETINKGQPLAPVLFAWVSGLGHDPVLAARVSSAVIAVLTLIPFHFCLRFFCSSAEAFWSDLVYVLAPFAIRYSLWALTHPLFNLFLVLLLLCVLKVQVSGRGGWAVLAGLAAWGAYLTRVEALVLLAFLAGCGIGFKWMEQDKSREGGNFRSLQFRLTMVFLLTFVSAAFPFWIWLWQKTGTWQITGTDAKEWTGLVSTKLWRSVFAAGAPPSPSEGVLDFHRVWTVVRIYLKNLSESYLQLLPQAIPLVIWVFITWGVLTACSRAGSKPARFFLVLPFVFFPLLFYPLFGVGERYLGPSLIFLILMAGAGIHRLYTKAASFIPRGAAGSLCFAMVLSNFLMDYREMGLGFYEFSDKSFEQKQLGEWIRERYSSPQVILGYDHRPCFYAGAACGKWVPLMEAERFMRKGMSFDPFREREGIDLVVVDNRFFPSHYPLYRFFLESLEGQAVKPVMEFSQGQNKVSLYECRQGTM